jgi:hypothetical protein
VTVGGGNRLDGLWFETWSKLSRHGVVDMTVYIHVPKEKRKKLEPFGKKGTFVGYRVSERVSWLRGRADHSEGVPPPVQVGERHLLGLTHKWHELRSPDRSFRGRRLLGDVRPPGRIHLF